MSLRAFNELFPDENAARHWFEKARWAEGPECPKCSSVNHSSWLKKPRRWNCMGCHHQFSVTSGTPMHRTHLPLLTWAHAIYLIVSSSKGISAMKSSEMLDVHYATAWHLGHRIRAMMAEANPILAGVVELDEMYAGAPPRKRAKPSRNDTHPPPSNPQGRGTKRPLVLVAAERSGDVVAKIIPTHGKAAIAEAIDGVVDPDAGLDQNRGRARPEHAGGRQAARCAGARTTKLPEPGAITQPQPHHSELRQSRDPRQAGRLPRSLRGHVG